jgi:hypothetical protein
MSKFKTILLYITITLIIGVPVYKVMADIGGSGISGSTPSVTGLTDASNVTITGGTANLTTLTVSGAANMAGWGETENLIGTPGQIGFGVGVCPANILPANMTPMKGYQDPSSPNYGNYQYREGSVMVWIPAFYYRMHTWKEISAISKENPAKVTIADHGMSNTDKIYIANAAGMTQVNGSIYAVTVVDAGNITIGVDSSGYGAYSSGGVAAKEPSDGFNETLVSYHTNSIQIKNYSDFANVTAANAAGYALHRAFYDGGKIQKGFFVDKYKASKVANGTGYTAGSIKGGKPLSSSSAHNPQTDLTGGANYYYSTIDLAHRRDGVNGNVNASSIFHVKSVFQTAALAMLSLAHGQYSQTDTYCAWYNATYNYPKGCNSSTFKDTDDVTVTYTSDGYVGNKSCTTGSASSFAKTTHNGQDSGVSDLNGGMYEVSIGITAIAGTKTISGISAANPCEITTSANHGLSNGDFIMIDSIAAGTLATAINGKIWQVTKTADDKFTIVLDSSALSAWSSGGTVTYGTFYAAKTATAMKSFTQGNTGATDHWGATGVAAMMDSFTPPFKSGFAYAMFMGSGTNQVLSEATSGAGWLLTGMGFPRAGTGVDATGTTLFGKDYFYQYIVNELCLISSATWNIASFAGVWHSGFSYPRSIATHAASFRLAAYPE